MTNSRDENLTSNKINQVPPIEFLWLGLYAFAGFSLELILSLVINLLGLSPLSKGAHSIITGILWFACSFFLIYYAKNKFNFNVLSSKQFPTLKNLLIILPVVAIIIFTMFFGFNGFKPFVEFQNDSQNSILIYLAQVFYYLGESSVLVLCIAFGQQFMETQFNANPKFPSGGLFLALTWGIMHIFLQGFSGGLFSIFFSVLAGIIFVACEKDFKWSYLFIALAFIL